ncbi:UNKNOWN [Stylonychia lemnae]|uniref:STOP protein n=1 Tax=Stylonychia lemnae TaxID=5949 RepID=A0A078ASA3_STYLE|nr:UNKNOWN [Stylonychia lemnae]|eukprot:CDW84097.1 UNKNOWN [Stylonychia lemnae]
MKQKAQLNHSKRYDTHNNANKSIIQNKVDLSSSTLNTSTLRPKSANQNSGFNRQRNSTIQQKLTESFIKNNKSQLNSKPQNNNNPKEDDYATPIKGKQTLHQKTQQRRYSNQNSVLSSQQISPNYQNDYDLQREQASSGISYRSNQTQDSLMKSFKQLKPKTFLRTNLDEYLNHEDEHGKCYGCQECIKNRQKILSYKYPKKTTTNYKDSFNKYGHQRRDEPFNYDKTKQEFKIVDETFKDFNTTSMVNYKPYTVEPTAIPQNRQTQRNQRGQSSGQVDPFISSTTYNMTFANWEGGMGQQKHKPEPSRAQMPRKFDDSTTYKNDFNNINKDNKQSLNDSLKRNEYRDLNRKGTLSPSKKLPFDGKSTTQNTFNNKYNQIDRSIKCTPIDELMVPHGIKMQCDTIQKNDYNQKPILYCSFKQQTRAKQNH